MTPERMEEVAKLHEDMIRLGPRGMAVQVIMGMTSSLIRSYPNINGRKLSNREQNNIVSNVLHSLMQLGVTEDELFHFSMESPLVQMTEEEKLEAEMGYMIYKLTGGNRSN